MAKKTYTAKVSQTGEFEIAIQNELVKVTGVKFNFSTETAGTFYLKSDVNVFGDDATVQAFSANTPDLAYAYGAVNNEHQFEFHLMGSKGVPLDQIPSNTILEFTIY